MTSTFQPGQHPDADQLSAFIEHALPPHEQQAMLAHLAVCPDCRAITYIAQPAAPEPLPHPIRARTPLFARWMLAFPAAAALAALIVLTIHIHNVAVARDLAAAADKTARLEPPAPPPPPPPEPAVPATSAQPNAEPPASKPSPSIRAKAAEAGSTTVPLKDGVADSNSTAAIIQPELAAAPNSPAEKKSPSTSFVNGTLSYANLPPAAAAPEGQRQGSGLGGAAPLRSSANQYDLGRAQLQQAPPPTAPPAPPPAAAPAPRLSANANSGIYGGTGQTNLNQNYVEGVPASNASATVIGTAATGSTTTAASASDTATSTAGALQVLARPTLPSKLPALSVANGAKVQIALDSAGSLFRSDDAGVTWHPVPAQWTGRATRVVFLPTPALRAFSSAVGALAAKASTPQTPIFQLTTDAGAIWISTDGQTWKQK